MILLLTLLSLCATECRVHQVSPLEGCTTANNVCCIPSHYLPCVVVEKCDTVWADTVWYSRKERYRIQEIRCHPDTLVDSGVKHGASSPFNGKAGFGGYGSVLDRPDWSSGNAITYSLTKPLDSADLADIRAMLREWRVEKCYKAGRDWSKYIFTLPSVKRAIRDSCECIYGGVK